MFAFFAPQIQNMEQVVSELTAKSQTIRDNQQKLTLIQTKLAQLTLPTQKLRQSDVKAALPPEIAGGRAVKHAT